MVPGAPAERSCDDDAVLRLADRATQVRTVGFAGAVLLGASGYLAGIVPGGPPVGRRPNLGYMAHHPGYTTGLAFWLIGAALLAGAWWYARRLPLTTGWVWRTALLWAVPLLLTTPLGSQDATAYACQGTVYAHGLDPYTHGPAALPCPWLDAMSVTWRRTTNPYGPLFVMLTGGAATASGGHILVAVALLRVLAIAGVALMAAYLPRLARACGVPVERAVWLGLATPLVGVNLLAGVHNDAAMLGLLVAALAVLAGPAAGAEDPDPPRWAPVPRAVAAGVLIGLAAAIKANAVLTLPFAAVLAAAPLAGRWRLTRAASAVGGAALLTFAAVTMVAGLDLGWRNGLPGLTSDPQWTSLPTGIGLAVRGLLDLLGIPHARLALTLIRGFAYYVVFPAAVAVLWWRIRAERAPRPTVEAAGWAMAASVLLAPVFMPWYALLPLILLAASTLDQRVRRGIAAVTIGVTFLALPDGYNLSRVTSAPGIAFDILVVVAAGVLVARRQRPAVLAGSAKG